MIYGSITTVYRVLVGKVNLVRIVNVGICGIGTVCSGVFNVLSRNLTEINSRANCQINISQIACRKDNPDIDATSTHATRDIFDVAKNPDINLSLIHISEPTRLLSISYAVFCLKKKKKIK